MGAFVQMPRAGQVVVVAHTVHKFLPNIAVFAQPCLIVIHNAELVAPLLCQNDVVKADAVTLRENVQLAYGVGLIAVVTENLRQRGNLRHRHTVRVDAISVGGGQQTGHHGAARRDADGTLAVTVVEPYAVLCQIVQCGGHDIMPSGTAHQVSKPMIATDHKDILFLGVHWEPPLI